MCLGANHIDDLWRIAPSRVFFFLCAFLCCCRIPVLLNHLRETFVTHSWQCLRDNVCKSSCHFSSQIHGQLWKPIWKGKSFLLPLLHTQASNAQTHSYSLHSDWGQRILKRISSPGHLLCLLYFKMKPLCSWGIVITKLLTFSNL